MIRILLLTLFCMTGAAPAMAAACDTRQHLGQTYTICEATSSDNLRLWHSGPDGRLLGSFEAVERSLTPGQALRFAMNAGMYHQDRRPVGLYIEDYVETAPIASGGGYGNFGLTPNGVLCIRDGRVDVMTSDTWRDTAPRCRYATQSGPMLVIDGALHPRLIPEGTSRNFRNGVGTSQDGSRVVFAMSDQQVNFHDFATLFRDTLNLPNALYLDGNVSRLYIPSQDRWDAGFPMGPIVGVVDTPG